MPARPTIPFAFALLLAACGDSAQGEDIAGTSSDTSGDGDGDSDLEVGDALQLLGEIIPPQQGPLHILDLTEDAGYVYAACYGGLFVIDVNDPQNPTTVMTQQGQGDRLYWVSKDAGSLMIESRTQGARRYAIGAGGQLTPEATLMATSLEGAQMAGDYIYIAGQANGLLVKNRSDLSPVTTVSEPSNAFDVKLGDGQLFVADRDHGLMSFDISNGAAPQLVGELELGTAVQELAVANDVVYVAASGRIHAVDVSDPSQPVLLDEVAVDGIAVRLAVEGGLLAVATWDDTRLYDVSDPADIRLIALEGATESATAVALAGDRLYVGDWDSMRIYAVDPLLASAELSYTSNLVMIGDQPGTDFGVVIRNEGPIDLDVSDVSCSDPALSVSSSVFTIAPGELTSITITADLGSAIPNSTCTIVSNDVDEPAAEIEIVVNPDGLKVGDQAPAWTVPDLQNTPYSLGDYQGEILLMTIFSSL
jgi:hypothetical protein